MQTIEQGQRVWLITGTGRGLGRVLAESVMARGDIAIGTTRSGTAEGPWRNGQPHILPLDVADPVAGHDVVARAHALYGRLDVLVNNAGYGLLGSVEEAREDDVQRLFDVNFHGPRRLIQAVLPLMRARRSGHIVNITSIAGLAPAPGSAYYAASKFALEGLSQSLAQEVAPLGIRVTLVEPGAFRTGFLTGESIRAQPVEIRDYAGTAGAALDHLAALHGRQPGDPAKAAAAIVAAVHAEQPPLHLVLGPDALGRTYAKLAMLQQDLERWRETTLGTDLASSGPAVPVNA